MTRRAVLLDSSSRHAAPRLRAPPEATGSTRSAPSPPTRSPRAIGSARDSSATTPRASARRSKRGSPARPSRRRSNLERRTVAGRRPRARVLRVRAGDRQGKALAGGVRAARRRRQLGPAQHWKSDYTGLAAKEGFVVVYPSGVRGWNWDPSAAAPPQPAGSAGRRPRVLRRHVRPPDRRRHRRSRRASTSPAARAAAS